MNDNQNNSQQSFYAETQNAEVQNPDGPVNGNKKGMAIAAMVLGILSIVLCCLWYIAIPAGLIAVILGALSMKDPSSKAFAITGIITGIIGLVIGILWIVFIGALVAAASASGVYY